MKWIAIANTQTNIQPIKYVDKMERSLKLALLLQYRYAMNKPISGFCLSLFCWCRNNVLSWPIYYSMWRYINVFLKTIADIYNSYHKWIATKPSLRIRWSHLSGYVYICVLSQNVSGYLLYTKESEVSIVLYFHLFCLGFSLHCVPTWPHMVKCDLFGVSKILHKHKS